MSLLRLTLTPVKTQKSKSSQYVLGKWTDGQEPSTDKVQVPSVNSTPVQVRTELSSSEFPYFRVILTARSRWRLGSLLSCVKFLLSYVKSQWLKSVSHFQVEHYDAHESVKFQ